MMVAINGEAARENANNDFSRWENLDVTSDQY